jgi:hypothetical protein
MTETNIHSVLAAKLNDVVTANVAWENRNFEQPKQAIWYRESFFPAEPVAAAIASGSANRYTGAYQVSVFAPINKGRKPAHDAADTLIAAFKRGTVLTGTGISVLCTKAYRRAAQQEPDVYHIPVVVEWTCDLAN